MASKTLVIVESPAKCKKIESYLGNDYKVIASYGHFTKLDSLDQIDFNSYNIKYKVDKYKDLKIGFFHDDIRWNYFTQYGYEGLHSIEGKPPILRHYSGSLKKDQIIV